jgi:HD-GYP domain-containing protein (c-di-GMP phosphodiesterase class II)
MANSNLIAIFLKRSLWITAILCIILSAAVPLVIYRYHLHQYELESEELLDSFIRREMQFDPADLLENPQHLETTVKRIGVFMEFGNLVEFKIWTDDARVAYAYQDKGQIGKTFRDNKRLNETLRTGKTTVEIESTRDNENLNLRRFGTLVEMYAPIRVGGKVEGAIEVYRMAPKFRLLKTHIALVVSIAVILFLLLHLLLSGQFKQAAAELIRYDRRLGEAYKSLGLSYFDTIRSLIKALELRDMETEGHSERVVAISLFIGEKLGMTRFELDKLVLGSYLHDIGKIGVPDAVLLKPGKLDPQERAVIETHVAKGIEIIGDIAFLEPATEVVLYHHEQWDGSGYQRGIKGEEIPVTARIFAVVDVFDALTSDRPYRKALSLAEAKGILREERGGHFDPTIVDIFMEISDEQFDGFKTEIRERGIHRTVNAAVEHLLQLHTEAAQG